MAKLTPDPLGTGGIAEYGDRLRRGEITAEQATQAYLERIAALDSRLGAFQHVAGMRGAERIIAVNRDPRAPIFESADHGIVGDLLEIIPLLSDVARRRRGNGKP